MQSLPPLNALKAFDAASRHLSFTRAAAELHVTHGAVSRQIALLEESLQAALFERGPRGLTLTEPGARLAQAVTSAFSTMRHAAQQVRGAGTAGALRVSVPPTLAMWWLIPRLSLLHVTHPNLRLDLSTSTEPADFAHDAYDAAIRRVEAAPAGMVVDFFLDGRSIPVCSPGYRDQLKLSRPADLARATLVYSRTEPEAWPRWLADHQVRRAAKAPSLTFDQLYFALQAALDSLGVAFAPAALVAVEIARGRLVALAEPAGPVRPTYALLSPRRSSRRESLRLLALWLKSAAG